MKASQKKPVNYNQLGQPLAKSARKSLFLYSIDRLWEALIKYTKQDPDDSVRLIVLRDKFMNQSAPSIRKKIQKLIMGRATSMEEMLKVPSLVCYNRDQEGGIEDFRKGKT